MKITVCRPAELGETEIALWREWQHADARLANPFLSPDFAVVLGRHNESARVAVLSDGPELVGFFPFERHPGGIGRSLAYGLADQQGLIGRPDLTWSPTELLAGCRLAVFEFDHLAAHQARTWAPRTVGFHPSPVIDLTGDWDAWLAHKRQGSPGHMKGLDRRRRKLERDLAGVHFEFDTRSEAELARLMEWKGAQYVRTGRMNRFAKPWFRDLVAELFATRNEHFSLGLARLGAGDRTLALDLSPRGNAVLAGWFSAYDPAAGVYSPGLVCLLSLIKAGREHGLARIEMGRGEHGYKHLFADRVEEVAEGVAERPGGAAVLRRLVTAPRRVATDIVLGNPRLRVAARETLNHVGRLRTRLS